MQSYHAICTPDHFLVMCHSTEVWQSLHVGVELAIADITARILTICGTSFSRRSLHSCSLASCVCCVCSRCRGMLCCQLWTNDELALLTTRAVLLKRLKHCKQIVNHACTTRRNKLITEHLKGSVKEQNISIYFFFLPIIQWCSMSDVLFTGGREVSDFNVLKYY